MWIHVDPIRRGAQITPSQKALYAHPTIVFPKPTQRIYSLRRFPEGEHVGERDAKEGGRWRGRLCKRDWRLDSRQWYVEEPEEGAAAAEEISSSRGSGTWRSLRHWYLEEEQCPAAEEGSPAAAAAAASSQRSSGVEGGEGGG
ncbi:hypothetical protein Syun_025794 [Stephania yunnanensis]|uniref:Uncharacterized protein n=1 Tax=Stephania yunnanensis TaxID=152371 RepID=A0AAP0EST2_9MAGN